MGSGYRSPCPVHKCTCCRLILRLPWPCRCVGSCSAPRTCMTLYPRHVHDSMVSLCRRPPRLQLCRRLRQRLRQLRRPRQQWRRGALEDLARAPPFHRGWRRTRARARRSVREEGLRRPAHAPRLRQPPLPPPSPRPSTSLPGGAGLGVSSRSLIKQHPHSALRNKCTWRAALLRAHCSGWETPSGMRWRVRSQWMLGRCVYTRESRSDIK